MAYKFFPHANSRPGEKSGIVIDGGSPGVFKDGVYIKGVVDEKGHVLPARPPVISSDGRYLLVSYHAQKHRDVNDATDTGQLSITLSTSAEPVVVPVVYIDELP